MVISAIWSCEKLMPKQDSWQEDAYAVGTWPLRAAFQSNVEKLLSPAAPLKTDSKVAPFALPQRGKVIPAQRLRRSAVFRRYPGLQLTPVSVPKSYLYRAAA